MFEKLSNLSYKQGILLAFLIGFVVRLIPELLSFPYPIGWDTIYYAYRIKDGVLFGFWDSPFSSWLIYGIMIVLGNVTHLDPFLLLKIIGPLLFGGSAAGIYFVAWKKLNWNVTKSLMAVGLFSFSIAALTISWGFYRNVFGVMVLLFTIPFLKSEVNWRDFAVLSALSVLVIWGHELAAVTLLFIVFCLIGVSVYRREGVPVRLFVAVLPALAIFMINVLGFFDNPVPLDRMFFRLDDINYANPGGCFFLTDYLSVNIPNQSFSGYFDLVYHVFALFALLYLVLTPLIKVGYFKDRLFGSWMFILMVGAFGSLVVPVAALLMWHRWMFMLIYPLTFFAINGLFRVTKSLEGVSLSRFVGWLKITKKVAVGLVLVSLVFGGLMLSWPLLYGKWGVIGFQGTFRYVPSTLLTSSVPIQDTEGTIEAFDWLNVNMDSSSVLLTHDVFNFWTLYYLKSEYSFIVFNFDLDAAEEFLVHKGYKSAYLVWWNEDIGWHDLQISNSFISVFESGRISVYKTGLVGV